MSSSATLRRDTRQQPHRRTEAEPMTNDPSPFEAILGLIFGGILLVAIAGLLGTQTSVNLEF